MSLVAVSTPVGSPLYPVKWVLENSSDPVNDLVYTYLGEFSGWDAVKQEHVHVVFLRDPLGELVKMSHALWNVWHRNLTGPFPL